MCKSSGDLRHHRNVSIVQRLEHRREVESVKSRPNPVCAFVGAHCDRFRGVPDKGRRGAGVLESHGAALSYEILQSPRLSQVQPSSILLEVVPEACGVVVRRRNCLLHVLERRGQRCPVVLMAVGVCDQGVEDHVPGEYVERGEPSWQRESRRREHICQRMTNVVESVPGTTNAGTFRIFGSRAAFDLGHESGQIGQDDGAVLKPVSLRTD